MTHWVAFAAAAVLELAGCWAIWGWARDSRPAVWLAIGVALLAGFGWMLTRVPVDFAGRAFAAYGGVYLAAALCWMWLVDGRPPDRWDLAGGALALGGAGVILFGPRG
jgi:small multidrug resistance family-3 protein